MNSQILKVVDYIIEFLLQDNRHLAGKVGYTADIDEYSKYSVIITPSGFFDDKQYGKQSSIPVLPLQKIENTELLFGEPQIEYIKGKLVVKADIIASSFFLISRYEEFVSENYHDIHKRFDGLCSLPYRAGFIDRPIVDEYGKLLTKWLQQAGETVQPPKQGFRAIYLTHDVDAIGFYQNFRDVLSGLYRAVLRRNGSVLNILQSVIDIRKDPAYNFQWLIELDNEVTGAEKIFFVKALKKSKGFDRPHYNIESRVLKRLFKLFRTTSCKIGLHSSYQSFSDNEQIEREQNFLAQTTGETINLHRSHYLKILPPAMAHYYVKAGITDDFTLAFASVSGFRLGTCHAVNWINPCTFEIEPILLHPLTIMDCTLSNSNYMGFDYDEAFDYARRLINQVKSHNGELVLLWHNTSFGNASNNYHSKLYKAILELIK